MLGRLLVGVVDLLRIVATTVQLFKLRIGHVLHQLQQFRVFPKEVLTQVSAVLGLKGLVVAVDALFHTAKQQPSVVASEKFIPVTAPDHLDDVPACATEDTFEFIDDALVTAHRAVQALQVAVDDEDQVIELFAGTQRNRTQRIDLVRLAVSHEGQILRSVFSISPRFSR